MKLAIITNYAFADLLCIIHPSQFTDIRLHIFVCGVFSVAPLVSFAVFTILDMQWSRY